MLDLIRSKLVDTGMAVVLELSNPQMSPCIIPEAEIAIGSRSCVKRIPMQPCLQVGSLECDMYTSNTCTPPTLPKHVFITGIPLI